MDTLSAKNQKLFFKNYFSVFLIFIKIAVEDLKSGKSPGCDYPITPDALKPEGDYVIEQLCSIYNHVYSQEKATEQFTTNLIVQLPKKGDLTQMNNYGGSV